MAVLAVAGLGAAPAQALEWQRVYGGGRPAVTFSGRVLTPQRPDRYEVRTGSRGVTIAAPRSNRGNDLREVLWPSGSRALTNSRSCATWTRETTALDQEGLAFRVTRTSRGTRAVTVTKNVIFGATWTFNVHVWDTRLPKPYRLITGFPMANVVLLHGDPRPFPWRACVQLIGRALTFKIWFPKEEPEPSWSDRAHTRRTTLPRDSVRAGRTGWFAGHIPPGGSVRYRGLGVWSAVGLAESVGQLLSL